MDDASRGANATLTVDLETQEIRGPDGGMIKFEIDPFRKHCLSNGLDNIGLTLEKEKSIKDFEETAHALGLGLECRLQEPAGERAWLKPSI